MSKTHETKASNTARPVEKPRYQQSLDMLLRAQNPQMKSAGGAKTRSQKFNKDARIK